MDPSPLMPWFRSFEGVTPDVLPTVNDIIEGFAVCIIFNQLQDSVKLDTSQLQQIDRKKQDFLNIYNNIKYVYTGMKEQLSKAKCFHQFDLFKIAKFKKQDAINELISSLITFSLNGPKSELGNRIINNLDEETKKAIEELRKETNQNTQETTSAPITKSLTGNSLKKKYEIILENVKKENEKLKKKNQELNEEKIKLEKENENLENCPQKSEEQIAYDEAYKAKEEAIKEGEKLDLEIKELEIVESQKNEMLAELESLNAKIKDLEKKKENKTQNLESFQKSTDPKIMKLLSEIQKEEELISPKYTEQLHSLKAKYQQQYDKLSSEIKDFSELVDDTNDDDSSLKMSKEIEKLIDENNQMNSQIEEILVEADNINRLNNKQSFLQHLRSSSIFKKP